MEDVTTIGSESSLVSIRKAPAQNVLSDTNEHEEIKTPTLSLETLRTIGRIIQAIKNRHELDAGGTE